MLIHEVHATRLPGEQVQPPLTNAPTIFLFVMIGILAVLLVVMGLEKR